MMNIPSNPPQPLLALTSDLEERSEKRTKANLFQLLSKLSGTIFFQEAPALVALRNVLGDAYTPLLPDGSENHELLYNFLSHVPLTTYEDYQPFVARFLDNKSPRLSDVNNLLAPGLPAFIAHSSGTSGGHLKHFLKYPSPGRLGRRWDNPDDPGFKMCSFSLLNIDRWIKVVDGDGETIEDIPVSIATAGGTRLRMGIGPMDDAKIIDKKANFATSPFAVWLLPSYHANIFMTVLFALIDPSLSIIQSAFSTYVYDGVRTLEEHWDTMINAIQIGVLPDNYDLGKYRPHIEGHFKSDPDRAAELRKIDKGEEGWLKKIWPSLTLINSTFSGMFASPVPKLRHHFGPTVRLQSGVLAATEAMVGLGYDANDTNLYRLEFAGHIEFLDAEKESISENIVQPWQLVVGKKYEIVVTNKDGLWRYQLNDIVEVAGFTPEEGIPLLRFIERKGVAFRVGGEFFTESFLRGIIGSLTEDSIGRILEFTTVLDERNKLPAYGFLVELDGEIGRNPSHAVVIVQEKLQKDPAYKSYCDDSFAGDPTIRILKPGTFKEYRQWKGDTGGISSGQIKVPTMLTDLVSIDWLAKRVVLEV